MRVKTNRAFTIVEVVVVISVVAILSSLAVITFNSIRQDTRDATRQGNATIISEALEKYYEKNGEYPSVASIANDLSGNTGTAVASKLSIPAASLVMPNMPNNATNGIIRGSEPYNNYIAYEAVSADNDPSCQNSANGGCDQFTLRYMEEATEEVKVIESRHSSRPATARLDLELSVTSISSINATWTPVSQATSYELQRSLSNDMSSPVTTTHTVTNSSSTGLAADTTYFFRVRAVLPETFSDWSDVQSETTSSISLPTGTISITATMSGTNARGTASGGTCPSGSTIERQINYQINGGTWKGYVIGSPRDVAATEGYTYTFQAQAHCKTSTTSGPWATSTTASVTRSVTVPSGLTITATMSGTNARGTATGGSCPAGTTIERQLRYNGTNSNTAGPWSSYTTGTPRDIAANQGYKYTFQQQARCVGTNASSGWVESEAKSVVRPITSVPPRLASISISTSGNNTTWTAAANTSCPTGTTAMYVYRYITSPIGQHPDSWQPGHPVAGEPAHNWNTPGSTSRTMTWNTSTGNTRYNVDFQTYCMTVHHGGPWADLGRGDYYERL